MTFGIRQASRMSRRVTRYCFDFTPLRALVDEMSNPTDQRTPVSLTLDPATTEQLGILARAQHLSLVDMLHQVLTTELRKSVGLLPPPLR